MVGISYSQKWIFTSKHLNQLTSSLAVVGDVISKSILDYVNIVCFLYFQDINLIDMLNL